jgi:hypothetical protein
VLCELRQKDALCPPVALAERVKLVGADVKINEGVYKIVEGKAAVTSTASTRSSSC